MNKVRSLCWCAGVLLAAGFPGMAQLPPLSQQELSPFDAATIVQSDKRPPFRKMVDLDLDGDIDIVGWFLATKNEEFKLRSYLNDGHGVFTSTWDLAVTDSSRASQVLGEIGFLDAGPVPDLCLVHGDQRHVLLGVGDGTFTLGPVVALPSDAKALALSDLDGDNRDDFVWADDLVLRVQTSSGPQTSIVHGVGGPNTLRVLLRDGPGAADVFLLHGDAVVSLFHGSPQTGIVPVSSFVHGVAMPMFDTGDVDGDGDIDGVVFGMHDYRVLRRAGAGAWSLESNHVGGPAQFLRDVDGDGDLDGACCAGGDTPTYEPRNLASLFEIALNDGSGVFAPAFAIPGMGSAELAGVVDVDSDGDLDLVAGVCIYYANGPIQAPLPAPPGAEIPAVRDQRDFCDCDGDGDPDVDFSVDAAFLGDGAGHFFPTSHGVAGLPLHTTCRGPGYPGDFDGDGDVDLLAELRRRPGKDYRVGAASSAPLGMALLRNGGDGSLSFGGMASAAGVTFALDSLEACASLVADLDADGDLDLVTRTQDRDARGPLLASLWTNAGTGSFDALAFPANRRIELALDMDLDGRVDLVTSDYPPNFQNFKSLRVWVNAVSGPPTFVQGSPLGLLHGNITVGNLHSLNDTDVSYPDLFYNGWSNREEAVLLKNGFDPADPSWGVFHGGSFLTDAALTLAADLNLDGRDDELVVTRGENAKWGDLRIKRGPRGSQFLSSMQILPTGHLVDVDLDGDLDLLGERIVLNRTLP